MANRLRARAGVRFYWVHVLLQVGVCFALLQQWWEFWDLADVGEVSFLAVLVLLYEQAPIVWGLAIGGTVAGTFPAGLPMIALGLVLVFSRSRRPPAGRPRLRIVFPRRW